MIFAIITGIISLTGSVGAGQLVMQAASENITKVSLELKDCYNKVLYTSDLGVSKDKEFKKAYTEQKMK